MIWTFENYRLDTDNEALFRDQEQLELRPKTYDVLRYLVEHSGELVRKETLLEAVWENSYVVEGVLTTSMSELRKLFGDTAKNQRYIATVYRRGYRFIATVNEQEAVSEAAAETADLSGEHDPSVDIAAFPRLRTMVGREQECDRLIDQLIQNPDCRILSLVGPGGIGKTHLAVMVVRLMVEREGHPFSDGFCFVQLQSRDQPGDFCSDINDALGLPSDGENAPPEQLQNYLEDRKMLLLIDNFEYYLAYKQGLTDLINAAQGVKLIVTSRESLNIPDAWFHPVNGLGLSDSVDSEAVRVFSFLAKRNQPAFDVNDKLPQVLRICEMVEGTPLALELAASWLKMLSMDEVVNEISNGLDFLEDQFGGENDRQGSVRAVFNETWQRLTESERTLLKQLSIFRNGANRVAISEVIGAGLPILARLVNKALLYTLEENRYRMHELIRQFAEEALVEDGAAETDTRNRHSKYYLGYLAGQYDALCSEQQGEACDVIQADFDNIRSAWYWALSQRQFDELQESIRIVYFFCDLRGHLRDGLAMFEAARETIEASDHPNREQLLGAITMRAGVLNFRLSRYDTALALFDQIPRIPQLEFEQAYVLRYLGDYHFSYSGHFTGEESRKFLEECIEYSERSGNTHTKIECLIQFAFMYTNQIVDLELGQQYAAEALQLARENSSPDVLAFALHVYAWTVNHRGDYEEAEARWREALDLSIKVGNRRNIAVVTNWMGWSAWCVGAERLEEASDLFSKALELYRDLGDRANASMSCADLATVMLEQGDFDNAREYCLQGMALADKIGRDDHYVYNLYVIGAIECAAGNLAVARSHLSKSLTLAWEQEEQTNKPVVVFYVAKLLYAEYCDNPDTADSELLDQVALVLLFLQIYPLTWQAFKDRARDFQKTIESESGDQSFITAGKLSDKKIIDKALKIIPELLS